jgi:hypothetical protein
MNKTEDKKNEEQKNITSMEYLQIMNVALREEVAYLQLTIEHQKGAHGSVDIDTCDALVTMEMDNRLLRGVSAQLNMLCILDLDAILHRIENGFNIRKLESKLECGELESYDLMLFEKSLKELGLDMGLLNNKIKELKALVDRRLDKERRFDEEKK